MEPSVLEIDGCQKITFNRNHHNTFETYASDVFYSFYFNLKWITKSKMHIYVEQ